MDEQNNSQQQNNTDDVEFVDEENNPKETLKKLREELAMRRKERDEYLAGWQRAKADFINARKDEEKDRSEFVKFANQIILSDLLAIVDSINMAIVHDASNEGLKQIARQLEEMLKRHGVTAIESINAAFDPQKHEAIEKIDVEAAERDGIIIEEVQKGYMLNNKVMRPAKVKVGNYKKVSRNE